MAPTPLAGKVAMAFVIAKDASGQLSVRRAGPDFLGTLNQGLGSKLAPGMAAIVQARLTPQVAHEAVLTGRRYPADEALAKAIVDAVAPENEVVRDAVALAVTQAARGRSTVGQLKRDLYGPALAVMAEGALP